MDNLKKIWNQPLQLVAAISGIGLLGFYYFYARDHLFGNQKSKKKKNILELNMNQLTKSQNWNIIRIVITKSMANKFQFTGKLITRLKQFLLTHKQQTLVNCAPLKLFDAGAQVFTSTLTRDDVDDQIQLKSYFVSALKCQLIMEKTITDIFEIKNSTEKVFLLCDTNSLDLKVKIDEDLWQKFLQEQKIEEKDLMNNYSIVFHVMSSSEEISPKIKARKRSMEKMEKFRIEDKSDDKRIEQAWQGFKNYHQIHYDYSLESDQNVEQALEQIINCLKPYLPNQIVFQNN